ncbi:MAG: hypothetical protein CMB82_03815 [Flammeovirgaceae bacterium]|nr:hypothetical protein [Flammeovirgaceae bacterium]
MKKVKIFFKQFSNSFMLLWVPFIVLPDFTKENEPTLWNYFFTIGSTCFVIVLLFADTIIYLKTLKKLKKN